MNASEAKELTVQCIVHNEDQMYKTIISKIVVACGDGSYSLIISSNDIRPNVVDRLLEDEYKVDIIEAIYIITISW